MGLYPRYLLRLRRLVTFSTVALLLSLAGRANAASAVTMKAADAAISGGARYYADGDFIGSWTDPNARIRWMLTVDEASTAFVSLVYSCAPACGGKFELDLGGHKLAGQTSSTGSWYDYRTMNLGAVSLGPGKYTVTMSGGPFQTAPMNIKLITLSPLKGSAATFLPPRPAGPLPATYIVPNFHPASCGWLANWATERNYCANSYLAHLDRVRDDPNYCFALSECNNMIAIDNFEPQRFSELKERIKQGRVELVNAFFLEPTVNLSGGEALAQMGIQGLRWQQQVMGARPRFCWAIDTCGIHDQMPQICSLLGLDALVYNRCSRSDKSVFWSESPDGSRILTLVPGGYADMGELFSQTEPFAPSQLINLEWEIANKLKRTPAGAPVLVLGGSGDYSLPPANPRNPTEFLDVWKAFAPEDPLQFTTLSKYFDVLWPGIQSGKIQVPTIQGSAGYTFDSFWIENPRVKSWYRRDEHSLQAAEMLGTISSLDARYDYPVQGFYHSWLQMLLNMDRNTLWGSAGGMVFESKDSWDVADRFRWVQAQSTGALAAATSKLLGHGSGIGLFNAANWKRADPVRLHLPPGKSLAGAVCETMGDGTALCTYPMAPVSVVGARLDSSAPAEPETIALPTSIETDFYSARIDPATGALASLKLKPSGREVLGGPANVLIAERHEGQGDPGDFTAPRPQRPRLGSSNDARPEIRVTDGPVAITVEATAPFYGGGKSVRIIRFYKHCERIDFETELNDIPNLTVVVAEFPLADSPIEIRRGIPFGFSDAAWTKPNPDLHGWAQGITPAVEWSDYTLPSGVGVALMDRGLPGREIDGKTPVIYLFNATDKYYGYPNSWLSGKGTHHFEYALVAHGARWADARIPQMAWEYNCPIVATPDCAPARERSFVQTSSNLMLEAMRRDGPDMVLRLVECLGQAGSATVTVNLPHGQAVLTDFVGGHRQELGDGPTYRFGVRPQQIVTLRLRTSKPVPDAQPLLQWDELVPADKLPSLRRHLENVVGHPPMGSG